MARERSIVARPSALPLDPQHRDCFAQQPANTRITDVLADAMGTSVGIGTSNRAEIGAQGELFADFNPSAAVMINRAAAAAGPTSGVASASAGAAGSCEARLRGASRSCCISLAYKAPQARSTRPSHAPLGDQSSDQPGRGDNQRPGLKKPMVPGGGELPPQLEHFPPEGISWRSVGRQA